MLVVEEERSDLGEFEAMTGSTFVIVNEELLHKAKSVRRWDECPLVLA